MKKLFYFTSLVWLGMSAAHAATSSISFSKMWTYDHASTGVSGFLSEIPAYDGVTNTLWVAGVTGVDVLSATTGALVQHIDTRSYGSINSVAIKNGIAAFAIENNTRTQAGVVTLFDTTTRGLLSGTNTIAVGALPDMLTFTPDGTKLLVANEGTPSTYGAKLGSSVPANFGAAAVDPVGSVTVIDMTSRTVAATATLNGVPTTGTHIRTNTGMDFEPEYIAVSADGSKAYVTLQEANAIGVLDLHTNSFQSVVGLGAKDFSAPGNQIDPSDRGGVNFASYNVKGLYMPDGIATYQAAGNTYLVTANEGDYREDDADKARASSLGVSGDVGRLQISTTDSTASDVYVAGARSFSIRDAAGNLVYDSGDILDKQAALRGIYDDGRSDDKGVEPEGVSILQLGGMTIAAIGLERTTQAAIALFDITNPNRVSFLDMIVSATDISPEGLVSFVHGGKTYLAFANEVSGTTSLYQVTAVPEPDAFALWVVGLAALVQARRQKRA